MIVTLVLLGQVLELRARSSAKPPARSRLLRLLRRPARRVTETGDEDVELDQVRASATACACACEKVGGRWRDRRGRSSLDESLVTGTDAAVEARALR
ncbi:MAG: hypothetical protein R3D69_06400 [Xanthobacteraceae bacterium]